jgi:adenosine deaminase
MDKGVVAIGLGGREPGNPPQKFQAAFDLAHAAGLPLVLHAGENAGAESLWATLKMPGLRRIGHGVRCLEDPALVAELRERQIPLEVCVSSNVALGIVPDLPEHPWPRLAQEGLYLTANTDGAAIFKTTLSREYLLLAETFGLDAAQLQELSYKTLRATLLPAAKRAELETRFKAEFARLDNESGLESAGKDLV